MNCCGAVEKPVFYRLKKEFVQILLKMNRCLIQYILNDNVNNVSKEKYYTIE